MRAEGPCWLEAIFFTGAETERTPIPSAPAKARTHTGLRIVGAACVDLPRRDRRSERAPAQLGELSVKYVYFEP